ncbi:MAG: protein kinase [Vicinamibacterales bacterium]
MDQTPWLDELALAMADGRPIDWHAQDARLATDLDPDLIAPLRLIERVVRAHRETTFDIGLESMTVGPPIGDPNCAEEPTDSAVTWGPLTILERIGGGSYGDVYRAHDRRLDRTVALKLLRRRDSAQTRRASAVIEEARLMARVRHPNVVTVFGAERIDGRVGLWMEYLAGQTLAEELRIGGCFSEDAVIEVATALCGALAAVHTAGLLHHDLKAQNVMRTTDGRIVLTDFGAGRQLMTETPVPGRRPLRGTPAYLAPEILDGQPASLQSEVYSLGVLLFYLSTGTFPDRTASSEELQRRLGDGPAHRSPRLTSLIGRCLAPNPPDRFQAMPAVAEALMPMTVDTTFARRFVRTLRSKAWLWIVPTLIGFGGASVWSARTPLLYHSSAVISMEPSNVSEFYSPTIGIPLSERIPAIKNEIFSRTRLERIIQDLNLYPAERKTAIMQDVVDGMLTHTEVLPKGPDVQIGFTADDPRVAQRVAQRLSALFMDEANRARKTRTENTDQFIKVTLERLKQRLIDAEANLARAQREDRGTVMPETIERNVAKDEYEKLLVKQQESQTKLNIERREIGETFRVIDSPQVRLAPIGPSRRLVKLIATLVGSGVGLILVGWSAKRPLSGPEHDARTLPSVEFNQS